MADDRWSQWQAEYAGTNALPTAGSTLLLFAVMAVLVAALLGGLGFVADQAGDTSPRAPGSFCDEKRGRAGWDSVCSQTNR